MENSINHCRVKNCPALRVAQSVHGYCSVHFAVSSRIEMFDLALKGKMTPLLRDFAEQLDKGLYPRTF